MAEPRGLVLSLDSPGVISRRAWVLLAVSAVPYAVAIGLVLLFGDVPLPHSFPFVVAHNVGMGVAASVTSLLLYGQAVATGRRAYAILGGTYLFVAMVMFAFPLVFPGALLPPDSATGTPVPLTGGPQSAVSMFYLWHGVFILGILVGSLVYRLDLARLRRPGLRWGAWPWITGTVVAASLLLLLVIVVPEVLPTILDPATGIGYPLQRQMDWGLLVLSVFTCLVTLIQLQRGSVMDLFLAAVGLTVLGLAIANMSTTQRWTLGWYSIRVFSLFSMFILMVLLIVALSGIDRVTATRLQRDSLSGALRRPAFTRRMDFEIGRLSLTGGSAALLWVDIDDFKSTNDRLGHRAGDEILRLVGDRLSSLAGELDVLGRLGGDEFALLCVDPNSSARLQVLADAIRDSLRQPYEVTGATVLLTVSIGATQFEGKGLDASALRHQADLAMFAAKALGGDRVSYYSSAMERSARERANLRAELDRALRARAFSMDYQPVVDLRSGETVGVEALVRWLRDGERVPAGQFVPAMRDSGQLQGLGQLVLDLVSLDAPPLLGALPPRGFVAVNLATTELADPATVTRLLEGQLHQTASQVVLEVTETDDLAEGSPADRNLGVLLGAGYTLAIDDFGTGFSNFTRLEHLRPGILKLDRSLIVRSSAGQEAAQEFLDAATHIGHAIDSNVLAEGVETEQDVTAVRSVGIDLAQGYHFSRPLPLPELLDWVSAGPASPGAPVGAS